MADLTLQRSELPFLDIYHELRYESPMSKNISALCSAVCVFPHLEALCSLPTCTSLLYLYSLQATSPMALCQAVTGFRSPPFTSVKGLRRPLGGKRTIPDSRITPSCVCIAQLAAMSQSHSSTLA